MDWIVQNLWLIPALPLLAAGLSALAASSAAARFAAALAIGSMVARLRCSPLCAFAARRCSHARATARSAQVVNFIWFQFGDAGAARARLGARPADGGHAGDGLASSAC